MSKKLIFVSYGDEIPTAQSLIYFDIWGDITIIIKLFNYILL